MFLKLRLRPVAMDDKVKVDGKAQIVKDRCQPKLNHEALDGTSHVVAQGLIEALFDRRHYANQRVRKRTDTIKGTNPKDQLMIGCSTVHGGTQE